MAVETTLPIPAESLIPHRLPMRLVDRLLSFADGGGTVEAEVAAGHLFLDAGGYLDEVAMLEILAQAYAAVKGYSDLQRGGEVGQGFLVGIRRSHLQGRARLGDRLEVSIRTVASIEGFAIAEGEVRRGDEVLATGTLKLWVPPVPQKEQSRE